MYKKERRIVLRKALSLLCTFALTAGLFITNGAVPAMANEVKAFKPISFETGTEGFTGRGNVTAEQSKEAAHEGENSLYVTGRTSAWNGATINVTDYIVPNTEYEFSIWVYVPEAASETTFQISTQIDVKDSPSYKQLTGADSKKTVKPGEWIKLTGSYTYEAFDVAQIYIETDENGKEASFYIDDANLISKSAIEAKVEELTPLKDIYKDLFLIGNAGEVSLFEKDTNTNKLLSRHFNAVTAENSMKPDGQQKEKGKFNFGPADSLVKSVKANGMTMIGHTLVWHQQSPAWMNTDVTREEAIENLKTHIKEVVTHYGSDITAWDVVNEAFDDSVTNPSNWRGALRNTPWKQAIGDDYLEIAFTAAREANPDIKLYYNDYNLDNVNKREAVYYMAKEFIEKGIPIDGIGMQGHYSLTTSVTNVRNSVKRFAELGLEISVTELDITVNEAQGNAELTEAQELAQAQKYAQLFQIYREYSDSVARVTFWGLTDGSSWRGDRFPQLFTKYFQAKKAYYAVADPDKFLEENPVQEVQKTNKIAKATHGTAVIGGDESAWDAADTIDVNNYAMAWEGAKGTAKVLWDEENLYILFKVTDADLNASSPNAYEQDSIEVFIDENNGKTPYYEEDDGQFRVGYNELVSYGSNGTPKVGEVKSAVIVGDGGYTVQVQIPFQTIKAKKGTIIGFDLQVNDANQNGVRVSISKWNDLTDYSFMNTEGFGRLLLF